MFNVQTKCMSHIVPVMLVLHQWILSMFLMSMFLNGRPISWIVLVAARISQLIDYCELLHSTTNMSNGMLKTLKKNK